MSFNYEVLVYFEDLLKPIISNKKIKDHRKAFWVSIFSILYKRRQSILHGTYNTECRKASILPVKLLE